MKKSEIRRIAAQTPFVDAHAHLVHPDIYALVGAPQGTKAPTLSERLLCLSCRPTFLSAGMGADEIERIISGTASREEGKIAVLSYFPFVDKTSAVNTTVRGIFLLAGMEPGSLTADNYDTLERALDKPPTYNLWVKAADQFNIKQVLLNMWAGHGAAYFCSYDKEKIPTSDRTAQQRLFAHIPTLDAHALDPFSAPARTYAKHLECGLDTLDDYEMFLSKLFDFLILTQDIRGIKVSEQYFRRLDYASADKKLASNIYASGPGAFDKKELCDYVAYRIFSLAQKHNLTVQLHTGMLWNDPDTSKLHPTDLCTAAAHFAGVRFDLLHVGYPYPGEAAAMAANAHNITLNLAWLPLISKNVAREWLVRFIEIVPLNKICFGTDVFDIESLCGTAELIRDIVADAAEAFPGQEKIIIESLLCRNAERLYGLNVQEYPPHATT